ncbi:hypothetical protein LSAT2_015916 [Lamellibrachia satsuma]|nr:hypothetical protein LSAT2_015916 [Lamellibrachia satsuma]
MDEMVALEAGCGRPALISLLLVLFVRAGHRGAEANSIFACYTKTEPIPVLRIDARRFLWQPVFDCSPLLLRRGAPLPLSMELLDPLYEKVTRQTLRSAIKQARKIRLRKAQQDIQLMKEITVLQRQNQTSRDGDDSKLGVYEKHVFSRLQWRHDELKTATKNISTLMRTSVVIKLNRVGPAASLPVMAALVLID